MRLVPVLLAVAVLTGCSSGPDELAPAAAPSSASPADLVARDGDRVTATGRVVQLPGGPVRLCTPEGWDGPAYAPGSEPPPRDCARGVEVTGVDLDALTDRREQAGAVEGYAVLSGVWQGEGFAVDEQRPRPPLPTQADQPGFRAQTPPCPAPEGGWPRDPSILRGPGYEPEGDANMNAEMPAFEAYREAHPEQVVDLALLRPYDDSVLLGVIAPDDASRGALEQALRPTFGVRLCVVVSRWTPAQLAAAERDFGGDAYDDGLGLLSGGRTITEDLVHRHDVEVLRWTDELVERAERHPDGLVQLTPWLRRV